MSVAHKGKKNKQTQQKQKRAFHTLRNAVCKYERHTQKFTHSILSVQTFVFTVQGKMSF